MLFCWSKWLQSDKKIKTLTDTAELIEDAVSATTFIDSFQPVAASVDS